MSLKERLFGEADFLLQRGEEIIFKSKASIIDNVLRGKTKLIVSFLLVYIALASYNTKDDIIKDPSAAEFSFAIYFFIAILIIRKILPVLSTRYVLTNRRVYVFERLGLTKTKENKINFDNIETFAKSYKSRIRNTGFLHIGFHNRESQINYFPMRNVHGFYKALENELNYEEAME